MLWANCTSAQALTANAPIPLAQICSTNGNAVLSSNAVQISVPGWYITELTAVLSTSTGTIELQLMADGQAVATQAVNILSGGTATVCMRYPVKIVPAMNGVATIQWVVDNAATVESAVASVIKAI